MQNNPRYAWEVKFIQGKNATVLNVGDCNSINPIGNHPKVFNPRDFVKC